MPRSKLEQGDAVHLDVFQRFSGAFTSSAWRPYFVRWERLARLRFDSPWLVRVVIEVHSGGHALAQVFFSSRSRRRASPEGETGFDQLRTDFEGCGYELRSEPRLPQTLLLKRFRPTGRVLAAVRRQVEARIWREEPTRRGSGKGEGGIAGALVQFTRGPAWTPSSCGWSRRFLLADGTEVVLAMFLVQIDRRGRLQPEAEVLLYPPQSADRRRLRKIGALCRVAGYEGKFETARPAGRQPFQFAHFDKAPITFSTAAAQRARLDELADAIHRVV